MKILLIAGHGQGDSGAVGNGFQEADLTRDLTELISDKIKSYADVTVYPFDKNCYKQSKYGNIPNYSQYDYVMEVHFNSASSAQAHGTEILVHKNEAGVSVEEKILSNLSAYFKNRGIKRRIDLLNMNNCVRTGTSYALLETCFISNVADMTAYQNYYAPVADAVVKGILDGFGIEHKNDGVYIPPQSTANLYRVQCGAFKIRENAKELENKIVNAGFEAFTKQVDGLYKVQCGAFSKKDNAVALAESLKVLGFEAIVI